jgi:hypothetical protein
VTDNFAATAAQVLAVLMLTGVAEARLIVKAVDRRPLMVSGVVNFVIYGLAVLAWISLMIYDFTALVWCLRSLAGRPQPGVDARSALVVIEISGASLIFVPAALAITSVMLQGAKAAARAAAKDESPEAPVS